MDAPARSGVPGPGLNRTPSNSSAALATSPQWPGDVVIAPHLRVHPELTQVLDEVEHEAVVVVDDQDPHRARLLGFRGHSAARVTVTRTFAPCMQSQCVIAR